MSPGHCGVSTPASYIDEVQCEWRDFWPQFYCEIKRSRWIYSDIFSRALNLSSFDSEPA